MNLPSSTSNAPASVELLGLTRSELAAQVSIWGGKPVHANKLWRALYRDNNDNLATLDGLPTRLRDRLQAEATIGRLPVARETRSTDGFTRKVLLGLRDGRRIETVLMRYRGRVTACVSSQAGCAMGCVFCATGQRGFERHLTSAEIVAQALHVDRVLRDTSVPGRDAGMPSTPALADPEHASPHHRHERLRNIVLMGMGEPLHNYDAVMRAVDILRDPNGLALAAEKITLSTVGVVPGIIRMADEARPIHLAVSLHAATQDERAALVPVARAWPLAELMEACRYYITKRERRIFFEWTLIEGKNDGPDQARAVGALLRGMQAQVNLIPLNPTNGYDGRPTRSEAARRFQEILGEYGLPSTIRQRRGIDIDAGCGQLAAADERRTETAGAHG